MEDWSRFTKRIIIEKPVSIIYDCWATGDQMEKWFLEKAVFIGPGNKRRKGDEHTRAGDTFEWKWNNWDVAETGTILSANEIDGLSFTFGKGGKVYLELRDQKGATEVILTQTEIPTDEESKKEIYVGCATGWTFWMANLKAYLEHGITLNATGLRQGDTTDLVNS
ncbi:MAG: SRPBCC family protein [Bacteroidales bacterium]